MMDRSQRRWVAILVAQWIFDSVPDRGGDLPSAFTSECDTDGLVELSVEFMIQYDAD